MELRLATLRCWRVEEAVFRRDRLADINSGRFFVWAGLVAMLLSLGTWLGALLYFGLPGFGQTGSPARVLVVFTLSMAVLGGVGLDALITRQVKARVAGMAGAMVAILLGGGSVGLLLAKYPNATGLLGGLSNDVRLFLGLAIAVGAVIALHRRGTLSARVASSALICIAAADLFRPLFGYNPCVDESRIYPVTPAIAWLQAHVRPGDRIMPINQRRGWSIDHPPQAILPPNAATVYGFDDLQGYDSLQTGAYKAYASKLDGHDASPDANGNMVFVDKPFTPTSEDVGARWIIATSPIADAPPPVYADGGCLIYEDVKARPVYSEGPPPWESEGFRWDVRPTIAAVSPNHVYMTLDYTTPVSVGQQWYPGWSAWANRKRVPTGGVGFNNSGWLSSAEISSDYISLALYIARDADRLVELRFDPTSFRVGLYFGMMDLALFGALGAASAMRRRPSPPRPSATPP